VVDVTADPDIFDHVMLAGAVATSVLALALAPSAWGAAVVTVDRPCYDIQAEGDQVTATASGFTPGDQVAFAVGGPNPGLYALKDADAQGTATAVFQPFPLVGLDPGVLAEPLTATDDDLSPATVAATTITISRLAVSVTPHTNSLKVVKTYRFSGFTGGGTLYAHYLLGHHLLATRSLGHLAGPCGTLKVKSRLLPLPKLKEGLYKVQWDTSRRYSAKAAQKLGETINVVSTVHFGG
jgi:hypothetical protein